VEVLSVNERSAMTMLL